MKTKQTKKERVVKIEVRTFYDNERGFWTCFVNTPLSKPLSSVHVGYGRTYDEAIKHAFYSISVEGKGK